MSDETAQLITCLTKGYQLATTAVKELTARAEAAEQELASAESVIDDLTTLVRDLAYPDPCDQFDHHGHCQTHGWTKDDRPCPHARARDVLTAQEVGEGRG